MTRPFDPARRAQLAIAPTSLLTLHAALTTALGPGAAAPLQEAGYATGQAHADAFRAWLVAEGDGELEALPLPRFQARAREFFDALGWGDLALRTDGAVTVVETRRWAECAHGRVEGRQCHFTTGLLAGFLGALAGQPVAVLQVEGAGGACRFAAAGERAMDALFERLQRGESADAALAAIG